MNPWHHESKDERDAKVAAVRARGQQRRAAARHAPPVPRTRQNNAEEEDEEDDGPRDYDSDAAAADALRGALALSLQAAQRLTRRLEGRDGSDDATGLSVLLKGATQVALQVELRRAALAARLRDALYAVAQLQNVMAEQREALRQCSATTSLEHQRAAAAAAAQASLPPELPRFEDAALPRDETDFGASDEASASERKAMMRDAATCTAAEDRDAVADGVARAAAAESELERLSTEREAMREQVALLERGLSAEKERREVAETVAAAMRQQGEHLRQQLAEADESCQERLAHAARQSESLASVIGKLETIVALQQDCLVRHRPRRSSESGHRRGQSSGNGAAKDSPPTASLRAASSARGKAAESGRNQREETERISGPLSIEHLQTMVREQGWRSGNDSEVMLEGSMEVSASATEAPKEGRTKRSVHASARQGQPEAVETAAAAFAGTEMYTAGRPPLAPIYLDHGEDLEPEVGSEFGKLEDVLQDGGGDFHFGWKGDGEREEAAAGTRVRYAIEAHSVSCQSSGLAISSDSDSRFS